ncbi:phycobilisome rod-core linker polypeptide [Leptothoe spongobia]|uniref:Phycobilisome rod-core linker polypeptide n=1 Tax=Leptothoe spongobia TAU-MAC 1115 TaxID=1967444 RepID=A0A947DHJ7_9CYAN|nr:phycobilisome rod-core linker polypeptide [Leptothoe spongobia]MBT9316789.1 phycobilisome rod-core linker polypeptide [Leptothoe spongobia TAU-MAC 1115]
MALWLESSAPTELRPNATEDDLQVVIRAVYKQVLGNRHMLDGQGLSSAESMLRDGDITVRGFVRAVATSDLYRARFFENSFSYRSIEANFQNLLGRAPQDQSEIAEHVATYNTQGYDADIDSYIDSDEYESAFGENIVPFIRGNVSQSGLKNVAFNRTFSLDRGYAASNAINKSLVGDIAGNLGTKIKTPAAGSGAYSNTGKRFRITVSKANFGARVTQSNYSIDVGFAQLSKRIQNVQRSGAKIVSISEVA